MVNNGTATVLSWHNLGSKNNENTNTSRLGSITSRIWGLFSSIFDNFLKTKKYLSYHNSAAYIGIVFSIWKLKYWILYLSGKKNIRYQYQTMKKDIYTQQ